MSDDTAAIAAYGTWTGESTGQVLADWALLPGSGRAQWRAIADAAITAASLRQPAELAAATAELARVTALVGQALDDAGVDDDTKAQWLERAGLETA